MIFVKFDRRIFKHFDWTLLALVLSICGIGILNIYSTGASVIDAPVAPYIKQIQWVLLGLLFMIIAFLIDYRVINQFAYIIYGASILLLLVVAVFGYASHGAQRWLDLGVVTIQPSEMMKLTLIIALARYFDDHKSMEPYRLRELFIPFLIVMLPVALILKQPDLGTGLMLLMICSSMVIFVGMNWKSMLIALAGVLSLVPIMWQFLKDYQKERLLTFLYPENDPLGAGYHILQSIIAIGSGGFFGKGYLQGSQTQLKFLPEQQTDFVFSVFAEEWGFIGGLILVMLFMSLMIWGFKIALHSKDLLGTILAFGITVLIVWQVFINMGMVLGLVPVVGIPLPFLSYGGSAMVSLLAAIGLLMNVSVRRFILQR
jgi:rod shape determining protein RodA